MFETRNLKKRIDDYFSTLDECISKADGKFFLEFEKGKSDGIVRDITRFGSACIDANSLLLALQKSGYRDVDIVIDKLIEFFSSEPQLNAINLLAKSLIRDKEYPDQIRWIRQRLEIIIDINDEEVFNLRILLYELTDEKLGDENFPKSLKAYFISEKYRYPHYASTLFINNMSVDGSLLSERVNQDFKCLGNSYTIDSSIEEWKITDYKKTFKFPNPMRIQESLPKNERINIYDMQYSLTTHRRNESFKECRGFRNRYMFECFQNLVNIETEMIRDCIEDSVNGALRIDFIYKKINAMMLGTSLNQFLGWYIRKNKFTEINLDKADAYMSILISAISGFFYNYHNSYFVNETSRKDDISCSICARLGDDENFYKSILEFDKEIPSWLWAKECKKDFLEALHMLEFSAYKISYLSTKSDYSGIPIVYPGNAFNDFLCQVRSLGSPTSYSYFSPPRC